MPHRQGFFNLLWLSVKNQAAQPVPHDLQFCEFQCPYRHCKLEATGSCEIRPTSAFVLIQPAPAVAQWALTGTDGSSASPLTVH
ncbi:MAG: hypothetical protein ABSG96_19910 [Terracidiphilus sp.]|jgi:hypothetical protein